jgi:hypothetical protein
MGEKQRLDVVRQLSTPEKLTRRKVLKTGGAALAAIGATGGPAAAQQDGLDAHTGNIEVVSKNKAKAEGQVTGLDGRRVQVGCEHKYGDEDQWHQSFYGTVHAQFSVTFILTIKGLTPGKTCSCRIIACPKNRRDKMCKGETKEFKIKSKDKKQHKKKKRGGVCPCGERHPQKKHITFCNCKYDLSVSGEIWATSTSSKPGKVPHHEVTTDKVYAGSYVYGSTKGVVHSYLFTGVVENFDVSGGPVYIDGQRY